MSREPRVIVLSVGAIAGVLYLACVAWDLIFPRFAMYSVWAGLFPGFTWLTASGFVLGLVESIAYGLLLGWLITAVPTYVARTVR